MHQTLQIITLVLISLPLIFITSLSVVCTAFSPRKKDSGGEKKKTS